MNYSPLRYPGGKNRIAPFIANICINNKFNGCYVEPYSGGASVALFLLFEDIVRKIIINDKDRSIYAFWYCVLNNTDSFCKKIYDTDVSIEEWEKQKIVQKNKEKADLFELGFSTFFLNRTNRSGIIAGGVIGGCKQNGKYTIDCRFNKDELVNRIKRIASRKKNIKLYHKDALKLINIVEQRFSNDNDLLYYFDPPYFDKGSTLYMNYYHKKDHKDVSTMIKSSNKSKWIVSYDDSPEIFKLYKDCPYKKYELRHTANTAKNGKEIMFFSENLDIIDILDKNPLQYKKNKRKTGPKIIYKRLTKIDHM